LEGDCSGTGLEVEAEYGLELKESYAEIG